MHQARWSGAFSCCLHRVCGDGGPAAACPPSPRCRIGCNACLGLLCPCCGTRQPPPPKQAIQCAVPVCKLAYHIPCALDSGFVFDFSETPSGDMKLRSYCPRHKPPNVNRVEDWVSAGATTPQTHPVAAPRGLLPKLRPCAFGTSRVVHVFLLLPPPACASPSRAPLFPVPSACTAAISQVPARCWHARCLQRGSSR